MKRRKTIVINAVQICRSIDRAFHRKQGADKTFHELIAVSETYPTVDFYELASTAFDFGRSDVAVLFADLLTDEEINSGGRLSLSDSAKDASITMNDLMVLKDYCGDKVLSVARLRRAGLDDSMTAVVEAGYTMGMVRGLLIAFDMTPFGLIAVAPEAMRPACLACLQS